MLNTITSIEVEDDNVHSGSYGVLDSNIYEAEVKYITIDENQQNSGVSATAVLDVNGKEISEKMIIQTKEGNNVDKNGKQLKGLSMLNTLCMLGTLNKGNPAGFVSCYARKKQKYIEIYDYDAKEKVPTPKITLPDVEGAKIAVCILRETVDKKKNVNNVWIVDGSKEANSVAKFLESKTLKTLSVLIEEDKPENEQDKKLLEGTSFATTWLEAWEGKIKDRTTKGSNTGTKTMNTKPTPLTTRTSL